MSKLPSKSFCVLPWTHLATHPSGHCSLCCIADHTNMKSFAKDSFGQPLNLAQNSVEEIMESQSYQDTREMMLKGEFPEACRPCYSQEERGLTSKRQRENEKYFHSDMDLQKLDLRYLELRLGNTCNVRCRSCNPNSSSQWSKDYKKLVKITPFMKDSYSDSLCEFKWPERPEFWEELKQYPNIEEIYINGGEPTLIKQHWKFLEDLIETGRAKDISLWYSVNMTKMPDKIEMWKEFKAVKIEASIDDLEHRNYYTRYPTKWEDVLASIEKLNEHNIHWGVMQTITPLNVFYLPEFYKWAIKQGVFVSYNFVKDPDYLDIRFMPQKIKLGIMERFTEMLGPDMGLVGIGYAPIKADEVDKYWETKNKKLPNYWDRFCQFNRNLDQLRGESFQETFPEFSAMLRELEVEIP